MRDRTAVAIIVAIWLIPVLIWLRPGITRPDGVGYFAYLPSTYLDHDLVLFNEWQRFGMLPNGFVASSRVAANGHLVDHWAAGSAVVWYPAFLLADVLHDGFARDGVSLPYNAAAIAVSALAGLVALLTGFAIARRFFDTASSLAATIATWLGSSIMWYSTREALMAHAIGAAVCALVVLASLENDALAAGIASGLAFAVRPQNATFILVPIILVGARKWVPVAGILIGALPQIVVTVVLYGNPLKLFNVAPGNSEWHSFERIWIWEPLLSWYHGLAPWTPLMMIGAAGMLLLFRVHARLATAAVLMFALQWFINSTIDRPFWGGSSFGQRRFDNCTILFLVGLAAIFAIVPRWVAIAIAAIGSAWTMALFLAAQSLDLNRYIAPDALLAAVVRSPKPVGFLVSVPPNFRITVLIVFVAVAVLYALIALSICAKPAPVAGTICVLLAAWFVICGLNDPAHLQAWSGVIARNRALLPDSGARRDHIALMRDEEDYLRRTGRTSAADATAKEINEMIAHATSSGLR